MRLASDQVTARASVSGTDLLAWVDPRARPGLLPGNERGERKATGEVTSAAAVLSVNLPSRGPVRRWPPGPGLPLVTRGGLREGSRFWEDGAGRHP